MENIENILKAINVISYEYDKNEKISIKVQYLLDLKRYIEDLEMRVKTLKMQLNLEKNEVKKLTGKLIECENRKNLIDFDVYV